MYGVVTRGTSIFLLAPAADSLFLCLSARAPSLLVSARLLTVEIDAVLFGPAGHTATQRASYNKLFQAQVCLFQLMEALHDAAGLRRQSHLADAIYTRIAYNCRETNVLFAEGSPLRFENWEQELGMEWYGQGMQALMVYTALRGRLVQAMSVARERLVEARALLGGR